VSTDRRDVDQCLGARFPSGSGDGTRAAYMYIFKYIFKSLRTGLSRDSYYVHGGYRALDRARNRVGMTHIGLDAMDLSDVTHRLQGPAR